MHGILDNPELIKILGESLSHVIADSSQRGAGKLLGKVKGNPRRRLVARALTDAFVEAFIDAKWDDIEGDESWVMELASIWQPALREPGFVGRLIDSLADPVPADPAVLKADIAVTMEGHGCDLDELANVIWVDQFLYVLPGLFWRELKTVSRDEPALGSLIDLLIAQRADARLTSVEREVSPRDYRYDVAALLAKIVESARSVPSFHPGTGGLALSRHAVVREGVRKSGRQEQSDEDDKDEEDNLYSGRAYYRPPVDYAGYRPGRGGIARPWLEMADQLRQVVVLSDPGMGKSWLVRTESFRHAAVSLSQLEGAATASDVILPVPVRCDQLARTDGETVGQAAASHFASVGWIPDRSQQALAGQIDSGQARLLLDAYDELPGQDARERFGQLLRRWSDAAGDRRWLLTSRIADYAGCPIDGVPEVELQALTSDDVIGFIRASGLPQSAEDRLLAMTADPAVAGMARIPLLLAMLCSLASRIPMDQELPRTRTVLYDRLLRWYLDHPHRSPGSSQRRFGNETGLEILSKVAYDFAVAPGGWRDLMPETMLVKAVRSSGPAFDDLGMGAGEFIGDFAVSSGLLVPEGDISEGRSPRYLFFHRTFAEYLTARHLASMDRAERLQVMEAHLWFDPEWAQVISMLGGHLGPPADVVELFRFLVDRPDDACYQALLAAVGVLSERSDRKTLLTPDEEQDFADKIMKILSVGIFRAEATSVLAAAGNLPVALTRRLREAMWSEDEEMCAAALQILHGRRISGLTEQALGLLKAESSDVRQQAVNLLAGHQEPWLFQTLTNQLSDESATVKKAAAAALSRYPLPDLLDALDSPAAESSAALRCGLLKAIAASTDTPPLAPLSQALADEDQEVRQIAVQALRLHTEPAVTHLLLAHLEDTNEYVREEIFKALIFRHCEDPAFIDAYVALRIDNVPQGNLSDTIVISPMPHRLMSELISRLASPEKGIRQRAADALAAARPDGCEQELLRQLASPDPEGRQAAAVASAGRRDPALLERLAACLRDESPMVRRAAVKALTASDAPHLADHLAWLLADDDASVRLAAAEASEGRQALGLTDALVNCVLDDKNLLIICAAVYALHGREGKNVDEALRRTLNRRELALGTFMFEPAARELNSRNPAAVLEALRPHLVSDNPYTQRAAAAVLTACTAPGTVDALIEVLATGTRKGRISAWWAIARRRQALDLVAVAEHLAVLKGESQQRLLTAARELAVRRYLQLPHDDRARVRTALAESSAALMLGA